MNMFGRHPFRRRGALVALTLAVTLTLSGCDGTLIPEVATPTPAHPRASVTPAPTLADEPAVVYTNVLTSHSVVSLILEGFTDDGSMHTTLYTFKQQSVPAVFFVSGIVANEHPETVRTIAQEGFVIGNYGLNGEKDMQENDVLTNVHQFQRGQELIQEATGNLPRLFRCNGSQYTTELLQAAAHVGLEAGVKPNIFLNHTSFQKYEDALLFVQRLTRGSVISIKLGQVLDPEEYGGTTYNMDYLAIDPPPFLSDDMEDLIADTYSNITNVVLWLLAALEAEGYVVLSPEALQAERITMFDNPEALSEMTLQMLDPEVYALPVTSMPLGLEAVREATVGGPLALRGTSTDTAASAGTDATPEPGTGAFVADAPVTAAVAATGADGATATDGATAVDGADAFPAGTVFLGDSITVGLQNYVEWERRANPDYLSSVQFLTSSNFCAALAQRKVAPDSVHPMYNGEKALPEDALAAMGAKRVVFMPGQTDVRSYTVDQFIDNLKLLIYQIRQKNPGIQIYLQSIPPGVANRYTKPSNAQLFSYNLAMYKLSLQYGIPFLDVAFPLRDEQGNLPDDLCLDPDTYGTHLNDAGCVQWLRFVQSRLP